MPKIDSQNLWDACDEFGDGARRYSGRGMYGRECIGFTTGDPINDAMKLALALHEIDEDVDMPRAATDSMGRDTIVYFPGIAPPDGAVESEDS